MNDIDQLASQLQPHYAHFNVANRLLFTGHSHQAWPDVALKGVEESFQVAAGQVDNKWETAFKKTEILRDYLRGYYDDPDGLYCQGENTHQLLVSWLSSFDLNEKPKIITTDSEFHSMYRQLHRLEEEGLEICYTEGHSDALASDIEQLIDSKTAAIMLSRVFFESGLINQHLSDIAEIARKNNVPLLVDDYHGTNVVPLSLRDAELEDCYFLVGGYKYLQWGEGNCFLRFPEGCALRPAITGWFASFSTLDDPRSPGKIEYDDGNQRFATGTYDPTAQFRAAKVVAFFEEQDLSPSVLRQQYLRQLKLLRKQFLAQDFNAKLIKLYHRQPLEQNGGFLALRSPYARTIRAELMEKNIYTDARGDVLRLGPAPYVTSEQIKTVITELSKVVNRLQP
ncbi:aminotransferase class V-fold PLP-dependent enzyme [Fodinibius salsisoli]|uniref:Aminotransferase class V-fold PLP-dependent enzyme n=1 Tax=Fodinibius salsisoli TaxID=2820877 RepID=A0ABT3PPH5_9BACT|nr:aminotransferase class V-fold PLP-dependent enzyme [Fodinibius salsisoli]MCW9707750.1 aminotransferase class V-fold PLP-dependent enzyme [Fodinibius salsisoli]